MSNTSNASNASKSESELSAECDKNIVMSHAKYFADACGNLTDKSMRDAHIKQGISSGVSIKIRAIKNMLSLRSYPQTAYWISRIENPTRTGIWNVDGTFNQFVFDEIASHGVFINAVAGLKIKVITKTILTYYLKKKYEETLTEIGNACNIFYIIPVSWERVTNGSITELFQYYADYIYLGERALSIKRLKYFYTNPNELMQKRANFIKSGYAKNGHDKNEAFFVKKT